MMSVRQADMFRGMLAGGATDGKVGCYCSYGLGGHWHRQAHVSSRSPLTSPAGSSGSPEAATLACGSCNAFSLAQTRPCDPIVREWTSADDSVRCGSPTLASYSFGVQLSNVLCSADSSSGAACAGRGRPIGSRSDGTGHARSRSSRRARNESRSLLTSSTSSPRRR